MSNQRPKRLEARHTAGTGHQIHADIDFEPNCVEFKMKKGFQPILESKACSTVISYDPWIQFPPEEWKAMIAQTHKEMVDLWNEKYATVEVEG